MWAEVLELGEVLGKKIRETAGSSLGACPTGRRESNSLLLSSTTQAGSTTKVAGPGAWKEEQTFEGKGE